MLFHEYLPEGATAVGNLANATVVYLVCLRLAVLDVRARGRNAFKWGLGIVFLGPLGWLAFAWVALRDWRDGRRGLLRDVPLPRVVAVALAGLALLTGLLLGASRVSVAARPLDEPERVLQANTTQWDCGSPAAFLARESRFAPRSGYVPDTDDEVELFRRRELCFQESAQRLVVGWGLMGLAGLLIAWGSGERRASALAIAADENALSGRR